jgi:outer membrane protein assembly factor BamA
MFLAAVVIAGTWVAAHELPRGEAHASAGVAKKDVRTQEVQSISIDTPRSPRDERRIPIQELRSLLSTKAGDLLDEQKLVIDRRVIEDALVARGYLAASVAPASVTFTKDGGAYVVFDIERGPLYRLGEVRITGPGARDADVVTIATGDEAVRSRIERARQTLVETLVHRAPKHTVEMKLHEDRATATVDVDLITR